MAVIAKFKFSWRTDRQSDPYVSIFSSKAWHINIYWNIILLSVSKCQTPTFGSGGGPGGNGGGPRPPPRHWGGGGGGPRGAGRAQEGVGELYRGRLGTVGLGSETEVRGSSLNTVHADAG